MTEQRLENPDRTPANGASPPGEARRFGHYTLLEELGRGAQGFVYLAEDTQLGRKVALKVLTDAGLQSEAVRERFKREAEITSKLEHPGICAIQGIGEEGGVPFIAMQLVSGTTLAEMLDTARARENGTPAAEDGDRGASSSTSLVGKDSMRDVLRLIERVARALHVAHETGLVHRDIKPANIMVKPTGHPVLLDFGLARDTGDAGHTLTETGQIMGSPAYMAPEQIIADRDQIDRRTDVYSLGAILYECLTLRRPFEAQSIDQLFHQVLQGNPENPRRFNPRIPRDLHTVIEVAMERDRDRRYATALQFAEDLRRVRSFEPTQARAAGPITRARKWVRRHPARAVGVGAFSVFVVAALLFGGYQDIERRRAVRQNLQAAKSLLDDRGFAEAAAAVARARERDPDSPRALELKAEIERAHGLALEEARRESALESARTARRESALRQGEYVRERDAIRALEQELLRDRAPAFDAYAPYEVRSAFARKERELARRKLTAEQRNQAARQALQTAARLEAPWGGTAETEAAFAGYYMMRWREALADGDPAREELCRTAVERHDRAGEYRDELLGRGQLTVTAEPPDAEIFLFRYEPHEKVRPDAPIPRLVPVPTTGVGQARDGAWVEGFFPGDPCLVVREVRAGSLAADAGLRPGDLILSLDGQPVGGGLFVFVDGTGRPAPAGAGTRPRRVVSLNGASIESRLDWELAPPAPDGESDRIVLSAVGEKSGFDREEVACASPGELVMRGLAGSAFELLCLDDGEPVRLEVPPGRETGLRCESTAYPLITSPENVVPHASALEIDPGSYLLVVRRDGYERQRYPIVVGRLDDAAPHVTLLRERSTPEGFVYVPSGPFVFAGDSAAREPGPREEVDLPAFFVGKREVTNEEWFEFVEDPETQRRIESSPRPIYVPRELRSGPMPKQNLGGPATPVMGVSWQDVRDYVRWRNEKAEEAGEPWVYDLPTGLEWEKAARGVDGRAFPWGDRFDHSLLVSIYRKPRYLHDAPGDLEPRDESPFGVQNAGGHRQEWTADTRQDDASVRPLYSWRGGSWRTMREQDYRSASRGYAEPGYAGGNVGFRLVARVRD